MKTTFTKGLFAFLLLCIPLAASTQNRTINYRQLAEKNFRLLNKDGMISKYVEFKDAGFILRTFDSKGDEVYKEQAFIPWSSASRLVTKLEITQPFDYAKSYNWGNTMLNDVFNYANASHYEEMPTSLDGLVVAIDPGHFAGSLKEAIWEDKYVFIRGESVRQKKDIKFYEAELADLTSLILENKLVAAGAKPFRSKAMGSTALRKSFTEWYRDDFNRDLQTAVAKGLITKDVFAVIEKNKSDSVYIFQSLFKNLEFRARVDYINSNIPNVTINIHYNAHELSKRDREGFLPVVEENYSMAFVPGSFLSRELLKKSDKVDFVRLLLSEDMDKSVRLAHLILEQEREIAGISQVPNHNIAIDERYCLPSAYEGVFHRNLALTRTVHGPVVYLEALLQDNDREAVNLSLRDYEFEHPIHGKLKAPKRCEQIAEAIYQGLLQWIEENKLIAKK
jgi:N-acetylmuramoyl-L-alanine amidase